MKSYILRVLLPSFLIKKRPTDVVIPSDLTKIEKLRGSENWESWKIYIRMVLIREGLLSLVARSYDRPKEPKQPEGSKASLREGQMILTTPLTAEEVAKYSRFQNHCRWLLGQRQNPPPPSKSPYKWNFYLQPNHHLYR